jgi:nucleoside-diphosphate-sugar epimerase
MPAQLAPIIEALSSHSLAHYIFLSSVAVYQSFSGWRENGCEPWSNYFCIPIGEEHAKRPFHPYGRNKLDCEELLLEAFAREGLPCTILRLPPVFGPGDYKCRELFYLRRVRELGMLLLPEGGHNLIHHLYVRDLAQVCAQLLGNPETYGETYNVATGEAVTLRRYIALIGQALRKPIHFLDLTAAEAQRWFGPYFYRRWHYLQPYHVVLDTCKVRRVWSGGYDLARAMEETVAWYVQVGDEFLRQRVYELQQVNDPSIGFYTIEPCENDLMLDRAVLTELLPHGTIAG